MKNINILILVLLVIALSNVFILLEIKEAKEDISYLQGEISSVKKDIHNSVSSIRNMINEINEENRWITPLDINIGDKIGNKREVNLNWEIKDYKKNSEVYFYYRNKDDNKFNKLLAKNLVGSTFGVDLEVELDVKPQFTIAKEYSSNSSRDSKTSRNKITEERIDEGSSLAYEYYIEVHNEDNIKTSERERIILDKLRYLEFSRIRVHITYMNEDKISFTVYEETHGHSNNTLKKVYIKNLSEDEFSKQADTIFTKTLDIENSINSIELVLEYDTGKEITKEIIL